MLEPPCHGLHVTHASSTRGATALGLLAPVVRPRLGSGVCTGRAPALLNMVTNLATSTARRV
jgi:hypothetical protein